jgi:hypothetical protein
MRPNLRFWACVEGWLLILTPLAVMHVINPIAGKSMTWAQVPGLAWVIFGMLAGLGIGCLLAKENVKKHALLFLTIFIAMALHILAHLWQMYGPEGAHLGWDIGYNAVQALLALWIWNKAK